MCPDRRTKMIGLPGMHGVKVVTGAAAAVLLLAYMGPMPALADTIEAALVRAYQNNPQLNAQRAQVRFTDENVPQALSGYRPRVAITGSAGYQYTDTNTTSGGSPTAIVRTEIHGTNAPRSIGATVTQTLFNGQQTANRTRAAESQVSGAREALRVLEQGVLLSAATIYMDYLRDAAIVEVQRSNVRVLEQTLKQTPDRFNVGEETRTDAAPSEAAAMFGIDVNYLQVKVNEGALLPTVTLQASVQQSYEQQMTIFRTFGAAAVAQVSIPVFQGGAEYALIRQSKETLAQQRLNLEQVRDQTRANVATAWGQLLAGRAQVQSAQSQVTASEIALNGVRQEAQAGQRTTLDVLNAQQALVNARVALVTAQHDRVVASYSVLNSVGRLSPQVLNLPTTTYDPSVHYQQVRDSWFGVRAPDGR